MEVHFATVWEAIADAIGDAEAVVQGDRRRTWADYDDRAARMAAAFADTGLTAGSRVGLFLHNAVEYQEAYFAAFKQRLVPVNVNYRYLDDELHHLLADSEAEVVVFDASLGARVDSVRHRLPGVRRWIEVDDGGEHLDGADRFDDLIDAFDPAPRITRSPDDLTMTYTGGTTGLPKGVMGSVGSGVLVGWSSVPPMIGATALTAESLIASVQRWADDDSRITSLVTCPLMHATGMGIGSNPIMVCGGRLVLLEGRHLDAGEIWDAVERERVTSITVVGDPFARPMLARLDEDAAAGRPRDLSSLRVISSAGAMFSREVKDGLCRHGDGLLILDIIASTEASMGQSLHSLERPAPTGTFRPGPNTSVLRDDGTPVVADGTEVGTIAVRSSDKAGYFKDPAKTAATFRRIGDHIWTFTGDLATVDADGFVHLLGRGSQVINSGGEKVFAEEVEECVKRHPAVSDCLVVGLPDERFGSRVVAVVSAAANETIDGAEVIAHTKAHLAGYKAPRAVVEVDAVPRAPNGKADYRTARSLAEASLAE